MGFFNHEVLNIRETPAEYAARVISENRYTVVGIFGASGSGKTTMAQGLLRVLCDGKALLLSVDDYWKYDRATMEKLRLTGYDWEARQKERFLRDLGDLKSGGIIHKPVFDYENELPTDKTEIVESREIIILEATLDFTEIADFLIFTYAPEAVLIERRLTRDSRKTAIQGRDSLLEYLEKKSLPAYRTKLLPIVRNAHLIVDTSSGLLYGRMT